MMSRQSAAKIRHTSIATDQFRDLCRVQTTKGCDRSDNLCRVHAIAHGARELCSTQGRPITLFGFDPMVEGERLIRNGILSTIHVERIFAFALIDLTLNMLELAR